MASLLEFGAQIASVYRKKSPVRDSETSDPSPPLPAVPNIDDQSLSNLVEREIIPRLVASHPLAGKHGGNRGSGEITAEEIDEFAPLSLQVEADHLLDYVEGILNRGVGIDTVMVDLLAPAARRPGQARAVRVDARRSAQLWYDRGRRIVQPRRLADRSDERGVNA